MATKKISIKETINPNNSLAINAQQVFNSANDFNEAENAFISFIRATFKKALTDNGVKLKLSKYAPKIKEIVSTVSTDIKLNTYSDKGFSISVQLLLFIIANRDYIQWLEKQLTISTGLIITSDIIGNSELISSAKSDLKAYIKGAKTETKKEETKPAKKEAKKEAPQAAKVVSITETPKEETKPAQEAKKEAPKKAKTVKKETKTNVKKLGSTTARFYGTETSVNIELNEELSQAITKAETHEDFTAILAPHAAKFEAGELAFVSRGFNVLVKSLEFTQDRIFSNDHKNRKFEVNKLAKKFIVKVNGKKDDRLTSGLEGLKTYEDFTKLQQTFPTGTELVRNDGKITLKNDKIKKWADGVILNAGKKSSIAGFKNFNRFISVVTIKK